MDNILFYNKLAALPDSLKIQVSHFIDFLSSKRKKETDRNKPKFGSCKGAFKIKKGFDNPLEDFKQYMQ
jgi:hypothetical protein